jgi:hypothetical protein
MNSIAIRIKQNRTMKDLQVWGNQASSLFLKINGKNYSTPLEKWTLGFNLHSLYQGEEWQSDDNKMSILWDAKYTDDVLQYLRHASEKCIYLNQWENYEYLPKNCS